MQRVVLRAAAVVAALVCTPVAGAWTWPAGGPVLQPFVFDPLHPYAGGQHRGIDVGGDAGAPVLAPVGGTISFAGSVPSSGKSVTIQTPDGLSVTLTHLGTIGVIRNAVVAEGSAVGTAGPSGTPEVAEPYVHLGVRITAQDQGYVDPLAFLPPRVSLPPPVPEPSAGLRLSSPCRQLPRLPSPRRLRSRSRLQAPQPRIPAHPLRRRPPIRRSSSRLTAGRIPSRRRRTSTRIQRRPPNPRRVRERSRRRRRSERPMSHRRPPLKLVTAGIRTLPSR